jgi:hypothetical protein
MKEYDFIQDSILRKICIERELHNKSWVEVALSVGGNNTADGVRMMYRRYKRGTEKPSESRRGEN